MITKSLSVALLVLVSSAASAQSTLDTVKATAAANPYRTPRLKEFEERRLAGRGGRFIGENEMRKDEVRSLGNVLRRMPGLRIVVYNGQEYGSTTRSAGGNQSGAMLGGANRRPSLGPRADPNLSNSPRGCWVAVYMDASPLYIGDSTLAAPDLSKIAVSDLAGAEFYGGSGTLPAQFSMLRPSNCGVLLLWTRER